MFRLMMIVMMSFWAGMTWAQPVLDVVETASDYYTITAKEADDSAQYWEVKVDIQSGGIFSFKDLTDVGDGSGGHNSYLDSNAYNRNATLIYFDGRAGNVFTRSNSLVGLADRLTFTTAPDNSSFTITYTEDETAAEFFHESYADGSQTLNAGDLHTTVTLVIRPPSSATSGTYWDWQITGFNVSDHDLSPKVWAAEYIYFYIYGSIAKTAETETSYTDGEFDIANPKSYAKWDIGDNPAIGLSSDMQFIVDAQIGLDTHSSGATVAQNSWAGFDSLRYNSPFDFSTNALAAGQAKVFGGQLIIRRDSDVPVSNVGPTADAGDDQQLIDVDRDGAHPVSLDGSSSTDPDGQIVSYIWVSGGNQIATGETTQATLAVGVHTIELTVTDNQGASDTDTVIVTIDAAPPSPATADAGPDQSIQDEDGDGFETLTLDGSGSSSTSGTIVNWVWTENETQIATGEMPTLSLAVGLHAILLTVTDSQGNTDTDTVVITVPTSASGNTYYLDAVNGHDTNPGTSEQPWKTFTKALDAAAGGDLVLVRPGDYGQVATTSSHTLGDPINGYLVFRADPATVATRPDDWWTNPMDSSFANPANRVVLRKLTIGAKSSGQYLEFDGFDIAQNVSLSQGSLIGGKDFVSHVRLKNLNGFGWWEDEVSGIYFQQSYGVNAYFHDILVDGCFVRDLSAGLRLGGDSGSNIVFSNNHVYHLSSSGIQMLYGVSDDTIVIDHNHVHFQDPLLYGAGTDYTHGSGISIRREKLHISRNIVHNHGTSRGLYIYTGIEFEDPSVGYQNLLIENNLFYDTDNYPMELQTLGANIVVRNNTIVGYYPYGSNRLGMRYYVALALKYHNDNVTDGVSYYNNVIVGGMSGQKPDNNEGRNIVWSLPFNYPTTITPGSSSIVLAQMDYMIGSYPQDYFEGSNNFFIGGPLFDQYSYTRRNPPTVNEISAHGYNLNECYELASGSPGIGFGDPDHAPAVDLYGNPRDPQTPCIGAFEFTDGGTSVFGRYIFYNNSSFDGNDPAVGASDDMAIATDKSVLLYGETATFANYTSYNKGINGIMIDMIGVQPGINASDFEFTVGDDAAIDFWAPAPTPTSITVRPGAGVNGSDRVTIIFADGAIKKQWLKVSVLATQNTGLGATDEFFVGNAIGETGNSPTDAIVDATDEIASRNNPRHFVNPAAVDNIHDFNRDGKVDATDQIIARNNVTNMTNALILIAP